MQNHLENRVYAGFFVRFVAFAIDSMIAAFIVGMVKLPFSIAAIAGAEFLNASFIFDYSFLDVLSYMGVAAYFVLLTYFSHSTPGKMLFRLEVVTSKAEWTFLNVLYRETIGRFLSSILCIGYFAVLVQTDKQGFHDMLCDTYVVYKNMTSVLNNGSISDTETNTEKPETVYHTASAFQLTENHPIQTENDMNNVMDMEQVNMVEEPKVMSTSYDNINPDSTNFNIEKKNE